jgi:hypothetical protein
MTTIMPKSGKIVGLISNIAGGCDADLDGR